MSSIIPPHEYAARKRAIAQFLVHNKAVLVDVLEMAQHGGMLSVPEGISMEDVIGATIGAMALVAEASEESAAQLDDSDAARPADEDSR